MPGADGGVNDDALEAVGIAGQIEAMDKDRRPILDMTPDGAFRAPARPPLSTRIIGIAVLVAVVAGAVAFAAFALWIALLLVPVFVLAVLIAVGTLRFRIWQARRRAYGGGRDVRPL